MQTMEQTEATIREAVELAVESEIDPVSIQAMLLEVAADVRHGRKIVKED